MAIYYKKTNGRAHDLQFKKQPDADDIHLDGHRLPDINTLHDLSYYKTVVKNEEKGKAKLLFIEYRDEIDPSDEDASAYKTSLNNYFISNLKMPIDAAVNKAGVDAAANAVDWPSVIVP